MMPREIGGNEGVPPTADFPNPFALTAEQNSSSEYEEIGGEFYRAYELSDSSRASTPSIEGLEELRDSLYQDETPLPPTLEEWVNGLQPRYRPFGDGHSPGRLQFNRSAKMTDSESSSREEWRAN
jgi:hypothetical protein